MTDRDIWREYRRTKCESIRNELVLSYLWLVKYIAGRLAVRLPSFMGQEDLESCGVFGLVEAVQKFDPDLGIDFEAYAHRRIRGSMIDEIRKSNWMPRTIWQKLQDLKSAKEKLEREERLTEENLAAHLGIAPQELRRLESHYSRAFSVSLEENVTVSEGEGVKLGDLVRDPGSPDPFEIVAEEENKKNLTEAIKTLSEKEQLMLSLYYHEGLTLKEIGAVLNVSESRVCQIHGRTIAKLKKAMADKI